MPRTTRYGSNLTVMPDMLSLPRTVGSASVSDCDTAWGVETDTDQMQLQMGFSDFVSLDTDILDTTSLHPLPPSNNRIQPGDAGFPADPNLPADNHISSGSRSTPTSSSSSLPSLSLLSSSSPAEAQQPHTGQSQTSLCRSQTCRSETCLAAALRILTTLHVGHSTSCLSAHGEAPTVPPVRKMETVLSTTEDAVASMTPILACPCSANSLVRLLLLAICNNLITWNSSMISTNLEQGSGPFSSAYAPSIGSTTQTPRLRVLPQPITIGQHQINSKLGRILHIQIIVGELRILQGIIDDLSRRLSDARSDSASNTSSSAATTSFQNTLSLQSNAHHLIISSLRTRLQNTQIKLLSLD